MPFSQFHDHSQTFLKKKPAVQPRFDFIRPYYLMALLLLVILAAVNYVVLRHMTSTQDRVAATINLIGRQRTSTQQIALFSLQLVYSDDLVEQESIRTKLLELIERVETVHHSLVHNPLAFTPALATSPQLRAIYFEPPLLLDAQLHTYLDLGKQIVATPEEELSIENPNLVSLLSASPVLLDGIEELTAAYQLQSETDVRNIEYLELVIFAFTLVVLALESLLIFRPIYHRIEREALRLQAEIDMRKIAETELQDSKTRYQAIVDSQTEAVCRYLPDGTLTFVNDAYCILTNKTRGELIGSNMFDLLPEDTAKQVRTIIENGRTVIHEHSGISGRGDILWQEWVEGPILDSDGQIVAFQAVGRDRTELKRIEMAFQESETRYRLLVHNLPNLAVLMFDRDLRFTLADGPFQERAGYDSEAMIGKTLAEVVPSPELRQSLLPMYEAALNGEEVEFERDRGDFAYRSRFVPVRDQAGQVVGGMAVSEDITERYRAEQALRENEERFRQLTEHIEQAFWMLDVHTGQAIYVSPAYETITGRSCQSFYDNALSFTEIIHPEDRERVIQERKEKFSSGRYSMRFRIIRPDGSIRWVSGRAYPIHNEQGEIYRIAGITDDITQLKEMEERIFDLALEQENARRLSDFIRNTSHDLRTPLSVMITNLYLLGKTPDPERRAERVNAIEDQIGRMNRLINDLLQMANLDNASRLEMRPINVYHMAEELHQAYANQTSERNQHFVLDLQPNLPVIPADRENLRLALAQLVENAVRYTPSEGQITFKMFCADEEKLTIMVQDTGVGIEAEHHDRIFERFYKVDTARTPDSGGSGLGLAMVKKIAEMHGGSVAVDSAPGQGSMFYMWLPITRAERLDISGEG
jgi:PAS domain S-box-containing protein